MGKDAVVGIDQYDLTTLLGCLASDLRNAGQAVRMLGTEAAGADGGNFGDADRLAGSLDRVASVLDGVKEHLCKTCRLMTVSEEIRIDPPRSGTPKQSS